jgi:hypothetical protein
MMKPIMLYDATNGLLSVTRRTTSAYGLWIEKKYVDLGWT